MTEIHRDPGSFKDPDAGIIYNQDRVYRYFTPSGARNFEALVESNLLERLISEGDVIDVDIIGCQLSGLGQPIRVAGAGGDGPFHRRAGD